MNKIEYKFTTIRFEYTLPFSGVTNEFIAARRVEIQSCTKQLNEKIKSINITTKEGVADFSLANHLVKYYFRAWCLLDHAEKETNYGKRKAVAAPYTAPLRHK